jgi:cleavage and polyadenylation specificity factor subunit 1
MTLFGKDNLGLPVITADFLPDGKQLYILTADDECNLHVLQFDPESTFDN